MMPFEPPTGPDSPEAVVHAALIDAKCTCEFVDIGVGYQKVHEYPDCPRCTPLGEACHVVGALVEAKLLPRFGTWSLPPEPGPEVTALRCPCHPSGRWTRGGGGQWIPDWAGPLGWRRWRAVVVDHTILGPLTDATADT